MPYTIQYHIKEVRLGCAVTAAPIHASNSSPCMPIKHRQVHQLVTAMTIQETPTYRSLPDQHQQLNDHSRNEETSGLTALQAVHCWKGMACWAVQIGVKICRHEWHLKWVIMRLTTPWFSAICVATEAMRHQHHCALPVMFADCC